MSKALLNYLQREHARLDGELQKLSRRRVPDELHIARLKKLKLAVKDQITQLARENGANVAGHDFDRLRPSTNGKEPNLPSLVSSNISGSKHNGVSMHDYAITSETVDGERTRDILPFADDDAAIAYALPLARGRLLEVWRSGKLIATVDERPCTAMVA